MPLMPAVRFEVLQALETARTHVAHGAPSVDAAVARLRLTEAARMEVWRAYDGVVFDLQGSKPDTTPPARTPGESADALELRELLRACAANAQPHFLWEDTQGFARAEVVMALTAARDRVRASPVVPPGPLFNTPHRRTRT